MAGPLFLNFILKIFFALFCVADGLSRLLLL